MKFKTEDLVQKIENADDKSAAIVNAMREMMNEQEKDLVASYQAMFAEVESNKANAEKFGLRALNKEEKAFYQAIEEGSITGDKATMLPETTVNYLFEDLKTSHELFNYIDFAPAGLQKWLVGEITGKAAWGALDAEIVKEIKAGLELIGLDVNALSAYSLIPLGVIDLGYEWMDKYVREVLIDVNVDGLVEGFLVGDGDGAPIGANRKLTGVVDGVYAERTATKITDFTAAGMANVLAGLTGNGKRVVKEIVMVVNPVDYFTLVKPASQFMNAVGGLSDVFTIPTHVVQAVGVPTGRAIVLLPNAYQAGINRMGIYTSDEAFFLEHARAYKVVTYGNGRIKAEDMAAYLDISDLEPLAFNVKGLVEGA